jgi:hypothetical protein
LLPQLTERGVKLVAISPQKPDGSLTIQQRAAAGDQRHHGPQVHPRHRDRYRHVIAPAIRGAASVVDTIFGDDAKQGDGEADVAAAP